MGNPDPEEDPEGFAQWLPNIEDGSLYAAKFDFQSGSPGYVGPVWVLMGDALVPAITIYKDEEGNYQRVEE
jgi:hypothetical protein